MLTQPFLFRMVTLKSRYCFSLKKLGLFILLCLFFIYFFVPRSNVEEFSNDHQFSFEEMMEGKSQVRQDDPRLIKHIQLYFLQHPKHSSDKEKVQVTCVKLVNKVYKASFPPLVCMKPAGKGGGGAYK